jgi:hypothetical protein
MVTSVPQVAQSVSVEEAKHIINKLLRFGVEATLKSGDISYMKYAMVPCKGLFETVLKPAANLGKLNQDEFNKMRCYMDLLKELSEKEL